MKIAQVRAFSLLKNQKLFRTEQHPRKSLAPFSGGLLPRKRFPQPLELRSAYKPGWRTVSPATNQQPGTKEPRTAGAPRSGWTTKTSMPRAARPGRVYESRARGTTGKEVCDVSGALKEGGRGKGAKGAWLTVGGGVASRAVGGARRYRGVVSGRRGRGRRQPRAGCLFAHARRARWAGRGEAGPRREAPRRAAEVVTRVNHRRAPSPPRRPPSPRM